jgi:iron(III) transport system ATP-binding protein
MSIGTVHQSPREPKPGRAAAEAAQADARRSPGIRLNQVTKRFGEVDAANGVTLELPQGQLLALLGPSGCGKTTTLRLVAGFEEPDSGTIEIGGRVVADPSTFLPPERRRVGMVFQDYALFPHLNVERNIQFGLHAYAGERAARVAAVMELVGLSGLGHRMPYELSGGQQQRVALARALAPEPDVVLLDEPFSNLDAALRVRVRADVRAILRQAGATAVFVTHDQEEALSLVDRVAVLIDGIVHQVAPPRELYLQPATRQVAEFVGDTNFLPGTAQGRFVETALGTLESQNEAHGPVDVLIRPENLIVTPASAQASCRVRSSLFFGHDQLVTLQLESGTLLDARLGPLFTFASGQPVQVRVHGRVMMFPGARKENE